MRGDKALRAVKGELFTVSVDNLAPLKRTIVWVS